MKGDFSGPKNSKKIHSTITVPFRNDGNNICSRLYLTDFMFTLRGPVFYIRLTYICSYATLLQNTLILFLMESSRVFQPESELLGPQPKVGIGPDNPKVAIPKGC